MSFSSLLQLHTFEKNNMDNTAKAGTKTTIIALIIGNIFHLEKNAQADIIFWMQFAAFLISIIVGILTACYYIQKLRTKKMKK